MNELFSTSRICQMLALTYPEAQAAIDRANVTPSTIIDGKQFYDAEAVKMIRSHSAKTYRDANGCKTFSKDSQHEKH